MFHLVRDMLIFINDYKNMYFSFTFYFKKYLNTDIVVVNMIISNFLTLTF